MRRCTQSTSYWPLAGADFWPARRGGLEVQGLTCRRVVIVWRGGQACRRAVSDGRGGGKVTCLLEQGPGMRRGVGRASGVHRG